MRLSRPFLLFLLVGGLAALLNVAARALINRFASFEVAVVAAFPIALSFAFALNRAVVFEPGHHPWQVQYGRFLLVNLIALVQVWGVSVGLVRFVFPYVGFMWHPDLVGHLIGVLSPIFTSYFAHKYFSFASAGALEGQLSEPNA